MICDTCKKYPCDMDGTKLWHHCFAYSPKPKPITNADHLRGMSDEELAEFLSGSWNKIYNYLDWLDWLKEEAGE